MKKLTVEERRKLTIKIVNHMKDEWTNIADKNSFSLPQFVAILTSFYTTMISILLVKNDKSQLLFLHDIKMTLHHLGFGMTVAEYTSLTNKTEEENYGKPN